MGGNSKRNNASLQNYLIMNRSEFMFVLKSFFSWRIALFLILFLAVRFLPLQQNFLGGGLGNYISNPFLWAWSNFDGEHYLSIAQNGYGFGERAFFPLFPLLIKSLGSLLGGNLISLNIAGNMISNFAFLAGLIGLYKLLKLDFSEKISKLTIVFLLLFPTSFYFAAVYTESLFLMLSVWAFYFTRRKLWLPATVFGILLCATRFVGIIILPVVIIEYIFQNYRNKDILKSFPWVTLTIPSGLAGYMYYLDRTIHDKFAFYTNLTTFGEQRSDHLITLPQVFYRYFVKILPNLNTTFFPIIFTTYFEFFIGLTFLILIILSFRKIRWSYWTLLTFGYLIPTFSGSFSSMPRYVIVIFPVYFLVAKYLARFKFTLLVFYLISGILLIISFTLFARGYWVS